VSNDWVVRYANRHFQLERQSHHPPARSSVQVFEDATGQIEIRYRNRRMRWTEITATPPSKLAPAGVPRPAAHPTTRSRRPGPLMDHPWRHHAVEQHYAYQQFAKERRAWERTQP
jgi:hypothetical protein